MFSQPVTSILARFRRALAICIYPQLLRGEKELQSAQEAVATANVDPLTGANNRAAMMGFEESGESDQFDCFVLDVDYFKQINDGYGHSMGDLALRYVSECVRMVCSVYELSVRQRFYRFGGDELVVFAEPDKIQEFARRVLYLVVFRERAGEYQELPPIMISYGCGTDFEAADADLYDVKNIDRCQA